jgi:hypothetical protein
LLSYLLGMVIVFTYYTSIINLIVRKYNLKSRYTAAKSLVVFY